MKNSNGEVVRLKDMVYRDLMIRYSHDLYQLMETHIFPYRCANTLVDLSIEVNCVRVACKGWLKFFVERIVVDQGQLDLRATILNNKRILTSQEYANFISVFGVWDELATANSPDIDQVINNLRSNQVGNEQLFAAENRMQDLFLVHQAELLRNRHRNRTERNRGGHLPNRFMLPTPEERLAQLNAREIQEAMAVRRLMQRVERAERPQMQRELHADLANMMRMLNNDHEDQGVMVMDDEDDPIEADINEPPVEAPPFPGDLPDEPLEPQFPDALGPGTAYLKAAICLSRDHPGGSLRMTRTVHPSALFLEAAHVCCIRGYKMPFKEIWSCLRYYHLSDKGLEVCVPVALRYLWQDGLEIMASTNPHFLYNGFVREHILSQLGINSTYQSVEPENNNGRINEPVYNLNFQLFADLLVLTERIPIMETGIHSIWKLIPSMQRSSLQYDLGRVSLTQAHKKLAIDRLKLIEARGN